MADPSANASSHPSGSSPPANDASAASSRDRVRRRNRIIASCLECRRRKLKCNKTSPCENCSKNRRDCFYLSNMDSASQQRLAELKDRMGNLEHVLERDVARIADKKSRGNADSGSDNDDPEFEDEKDLEPTPFAQFDQVYEDNADDDLFDLGVQLGKLRVSERVGGFARPKLVEELGKYSERNQSHQPDYINNDPSVQRYPMNGTPTAFLGPGPDYIAPASTFFFPSQSKSPLHDYMPSRSVCEKILDNYWQACHPIVTIVHRPSFMTTYQLFWQAIMMGAEPPASTQALLFATLFTSAVSMSDEHCHKQTTLPRRLLIERLQAGTEAALAKANFLRTTKLETMQAFVSYLVPLCRAEVSRAHSALTGTAIRLAECMGLHRDGEYYKFSAVETHVRRLVWYQLCFLDIRTCEATGPRPQIRREDFDTRLPLNVNEIDLTQTSPPTEDLPHFTDMTLSRIRFECFEQHRQTWIDIQRVEQKKLQLGAALHRIQKWKTDMEARTMPLLDGSDVRQVLAMHVYRISSSRLFIMLLHRFYASARTPIPDRLRKILLDATFATNEFAAALETRHDLAYWAWYRGALAQYHSGIILLLEAYQYPESQDSARIWKLLDYIFELPNTIPNSTKIESILFTLRDRLSVYQSLRKLRAPKGAEEAIETIREQLKDGVKPKVSFHRYPGQQFAHATTAQMDMTQFSMPPLRPTHSASESEGHVPGLRHPSSSQSPLDTHAITTEEIDWGEWDQYPVDSTGFGIADLPDLNLGSFTTFASSGMPHAIARAGEQPHQADEVFVQGQLPFYQ